MRQTGQWTHSHVLLEELLQQTRPLGHAWEPHLRTQTHRHTAVSTLLKNRVLTTLRELVMQTWPSLPHLGEH